MKTSSGSAGKGGKKCPRGSTPFLARTVCREYEWQLSDVDRDIRNRHCTRKAAQAKLSDLLSAARKDLAVGRMNQEHYDWLNALSTDIQSRLDLYLASKD